MTRRYLYRQDIAVMLDVSVKQVQRNERRWGLTPAKERLNGRVVRYKSALALAALRKFFNDSALVS